MMTLRSAIMGGMSTEPSQRKVAAEVAELLARLLDRVERGELDASAQLRRRLETARLACESIASEDTLNSK